MISSKKFFGYHVSFRKLFNGVKNSVNRWGCMEF